MSDLDLLAAVTKAIHDVDCEQGDACQMLLDLHGRYARYAQAAIDAVRANQLPDGGMWQTVSRGHTQQTIWYGPMEYIPPEKPQDVLATPHPYPAIEIDP